MKSLLSLALLTLLSNPVLAASGRPAVIDKAGLFSSAAVERANSLLAEIRERYGIDLYVDTVKQIPGVDPERLRTMRSRERAALLRSIAEQRAEDARIDGIYILVSTEPRNTLLVGWPPGREWEGTWWTPRFVEDGGGLSNYKRENDLRRPFARKLGDNPDDALQELVDHFRVVVRSRSRDPASPLTTWPALALVGGLFGLWVLLSLLRSWRARQEAAVTGVPAGPIYLPAMLGSLFGVPAAYWVYDRLFRLERPCTSPPPDESAHPGTPPAQPATGEPAGDPADVSASL
jgi:hypothetical protein